MIGVTVARFDGVDFSYPPAEPRRGHPFTLRGVSFDLDEGEVFGVLGPNSAGKTTLIRLLTRIVSPTRERSRSTASPSRR